MASVAEANATLAKNIETVTGKTISAWVRQTRATGYAKHGEILRWLKSEHGLGHSYANYIAKVTLTPDNADDESLVSAQYAGKKGGLKPLYDALIQTVSDLGQDVEVAPKKNNVSIRRDKQFALLQPSSAERIDVGLILKGVKPAGRLEASGSFNAMFTHRVRISTKADIDAEFKRWLKQAYAEAQKP
jgi:hypothetical protein